MGVLLLQSIVSAQSLYECPVPLDPDYLADSYILENGLFECGDPNNLTPSYGTVYNFEPPLFWERFPDPNTIDDCYAALRSSFNPLRVDWEITAPYEGDRFVLLSTGGEYDDPKSIIACTIVQEVFLDAGDTIMGAYFFGTSDYLPYNDYASIILDPVPPDEPGEPNTNKPILLAECDVETVGDYGSTQDLSPSTNGWVAFSHVIEPNQIGSYNFMCKVKDVEDRMLNSYLAIDGVYICRGGIPLGDLNRDCKVDLADYSILSKAWLSFCSVPSVDDPDFPGDPNDYPEPADPSIMDACLSADIDDSWFVDANDLMIMADDWLINPPTY